jgi:hypothetical protein
MQGLVGLGQDLKPPQKSGKKLAGSLGFPPQKSGKKLAGSLGCPPQKSGKKIGGQFGLPAKVCSNDLSLSDPFSDRSRYRGGG